MKEEERELGELWNKFITSVKQAKETWEELQDKYQFSDLRDFEELDPKAVKMLSVYRRAKFEVLIPRFIDYYRGQGGLDAMVAVLPAEEKPKQRGSKKNA